MIRFFKNENWDGFETRHGRALAPAMLLACSAALGVVSAGCADADGLPVANRDLAVTDDVDPPSATYDYHFPGATLPRDAFNAFRSDPEFTQWPWVCDPEFMHDTDPTPNEFCYRGEWELTNGVLFGWDERSLGCTMPDQIELIRASLETTAQVTILTDRKTVPSVKMCLADNDFSNAQIEAIHFAPVAVDGPWIRDYGPEFLGRCDRSSDARAVVDPNYPHVLPRPDNCRPLERGPLLSFGRSNDDASPTRLAQLVQEQRVEMAGVDSLSVHRPPLIFEGGNIFTDGNGTCFRNELDAEARNTELFFPPWLLGGWSYTASQVNQLISEYYNCSRVIVLDSMRPTSFADSGPGVIDHIDMTMTLLSQDTVLLGDYNYRTPEGEYLTRSETAAPDDAFNDAILDANAARLEAEGYKVVRIPMPAPYCVRDEAMNCRADRDLTADTIIDCPPETFDDQGRFVGGTDAETGKPIFRTWATFANSIRIGDKLMMPSYHTSSLALAPDHRDLLQAQEREAYRVYQAELDRLNGAGTVPVVRVLSDGLAPCVGSLQCITKTY